MSSEQNQTNKELRFIAIEIRLLVQAVRRERSDSLWCQKTSETQEGELMSYIVRPGRLPGVVCCHLVVCMVAQFQKFTPVLKLKNKNSNKK